jgi:hypothetical protein
MVFVASSTSTFISCSSVRRLQLFFNFDLFLPWMGCHNRPIFCKIVISLGITVFHVDHLNKCEHLGCAANLLPTDHYLRFDLLLPLRYNPAHRV